MIRSLRLRFFLTTWPLVVIAVLGVAWSFQRWTEIELNELITSHGGSPPQALNDLRDSLGAQFSVTAFATVGPDTLKALAATVGLVGHAVVLTQPGRVWLSTDPDLTVRSWPDGSNGLADFEREIRLDVTAEGSLESVESLSLHGIPIGSGGGSERAWLYHIPPAELSANPALMPLVRADVRRTLWVAVLLTSATAAAAALLLAGPLVRQVTHLSEGAAAVQRGALATRVEDGGDDELGRLGRSFNAMAEALESADRVKRNMVSDVAHELRTPLTNLIGTLEAIQDGVKRPDQATVDSLAEEAELLSSLVDEFQDLALAESGRIAYDIVNLDAVEEATAAIAACAVLGPDITLVGGDSRARLFVRADSRRLRQLLTNLLRNAITHTSPNGSISIRVERQESWIAFVVRDTGSGIPQDHLNLIWERFHRVDPSRDRASGGMGLGLAVVRQFALAMDGHVGVESVEGIGSEFTVRLPSVDEVASRLPVK